MERINIYEDGDVDGGRKLAGWFDPGTATRYSAGHRHDGDNMVSVITGSQWIDEYLYCTKGGRWVLRRDATRYHDGPDHYRFVTAEQARDWLLRSECNDDAIDYWFGPVEPEQGPGRPEIGPAVQVRFPGALLAKIDGLARDAGVSRAEQVRRLVAAGIDTDDS